DQPAFERLARALVTCACQSRHPVRQLQLVPYAEIARSQKAASQVKRRRRTAGTDPRRSSTSIEQNQLAITAKHRVDSDPAAEIREIGAAGHTDVLTIIYQLACGRILK